MLDALAALAPSAGVCALFVFAFRKMVAADRHERAAQARLEAEEDRRAAREAGRAPDGTTGPGRPPVAP